MRPGLACAFVDPADREIGERVGPVELAGPGFKRLVVEPHQAAGPVGISGSSRLRARDVQRQVVLPSISVHNRTFGLRGLASHDCDLQRGIVHVRQVQFRRR